MSQKLLTVFGATGNQGGSVVSAILASSKLSSKYKIRAITRDPSKPNAQALAAKGVELAKADLNDKDSVAKAIAGSYGVFAVTNYWETTSKTIEVQQGHNIVDACIETGVKHFVWSGLPHVEDLTQGVLSKVEHFDSKAAVTDYANSAKKGTGLLVSTFMPAFFMSNLTGNFKVDESTGVVTLNQPWHATTTQLPMIDIRTDTGKFVAGLWEAGEAADGVAVQGVSEWVTPQQVVDTLSKVVGRDIAFKETPLSVEAAAATGNRIQEELMQNMLLIRDYNYYGLGTEKKQAESDKFFLEGEKKVTWEEFVKAYGQWQW